MHAKYYYSGRSYPEDYSGENGQYLQTCYDCHKLFVGHKRRIVCKRCLHGIPVRPERARRGKKA